MSKELELLEEIAARCRRLETRQTRISLSQGFDPTGGKVRMTQIEGLPPTFEVSGLDISLGDIKKHLTESGNDGRVVHLLYREQLVAVVTVLAVPTQGESA